MESTACTYNFGPCIHVLTFQTGCWINKAVKPECFKYCKYVLIHTDKIIAIYHKHHDTIEGVAKVFNLKNYPDTEQT